MDSGVTTSYMRARRVFRPLQRAFSLARRKVGVGALLVFVTVAGASLAVAYTASASDVGTAGSGLVDVSQLGDTGATSADETTTDAGTTSEAQETTTEEAAPPPPPPETTTDETPVDQPPPPPVTVTDPGPPVGGKNPPPTPPQPVIKKTHTNRPAETSEGAHATVWIHLALPDPTPAAMRLDPAFARQLKLVSRAAGVRWWLVLAVVRARGGDTRVPATSAELRRIAARLALLRETHSRWHAVLALGHRHHRFANRAMALARYDRAVGLRSLVQGLEAAKPRLEHKVLRDSHIDIYAGGRADIALHRVDVRVLVLVRYLRFTFKQVTVSSLFSGHRYYARPGVVSAHMYGLAADISAVAKTPIIGNQQPGGVTERAIKAILRLPSELQPQQVISLLGLGGPSFPLADHYDHIHVGF
jgi:hypothetical protein